MKNFKVMSTFSPTGDQPQAIESLAEGVAAQLASEFKLFSPKISAA